MSHAVRVGAHPFLGGVVLALALLAARSAAYLQEVQDAHGLQIHRVHVKFVADVSRETRQQLEQRFGLFNGEEREPQVWIYRLLDQSERNIQALVNHPLVADTHYIDRVRFRVVPDGPGLPGWRLALLERGWLRYVSWAVAALGLLVVWVGRRGIGALGALLARGALRLGWAARDAIKVERPHGATWSLQSPTVSEGHAPSQREYLIATLLSLAFLTPLLIYGPYEEEVVQHSIFPNQMFFRELFRGRWLYWLNDLGFGTPLPGEQLLHPIVGPLLAFASLRVAMSVAWVLHAALMAVYFVRLAALSGIRLPRLRLVLLAVYLWSAVAMYYFYDTDWLTNAISWGLYPVLVFALYQAVRCVSPSGFWLRTIGLALLFAFWILNAHAGYIAPAVIVLACYAAAAAVPSRRVYASLVVGGVLCSIACGAYVFRLAHEAALFEATTPFTRSGVSFWSYVEAAFAYGRVSRRGPLLGLVVLIGALVALATPATRRHPHLRGCAVAFVAAIGFSVVPRNIGQWLSPSGTEFFRDPFIFFGLLLGGATLQRELDASPGRSLAATALLGLQLVQQGATVVVPGLLDYRDHTGRLRFYEYQGRPVGLGQSLVNAATPAGRRVYMSPQVYAASRAWLTPVGLHFSSDLVMLGLNPVNGWFKNVDMGVLAPPHSLMESTIIGDMHTVENRRLLDVLGINLVLVSEAEGRPDMPLVTRLSIRAPDLDGDVLVLRNPNAWPKAVFLEPGAVTLTLPRHAGCTDNGALCLDYEDLAARRVAGDVTLRERNGEYVARLTPVANERLLFLSGLYRPEWEASAADGRRLTVQPIARAFMGVTIPPGTGEVKLEYRPRRLETLTWVSNLALVTLSLAWLLLWRRSPAAAVA